MAAQITTSGAIFLGPWSPVAAGDFLEHADVYGNYYGTSRRWIDLYKGQEVGIIVNSRFADATRVAWGNDAVRLDDADAGRVAGSRASQQGHGPVTARRPGAGR